ncbi:wax ester/triacylglycerol synthase family O-acyltransferase [Gordonia sinesedis]
MHRMTAADAQSYWTSAAIPNDQFLLYCFAAPDLSPKDMPAVANAALARAAAVDDLCLRVLDIPGHLDRPYWIAADVHDDQVVRHRVADWAECLNRLGHVMSDQLVPAHRCWRLHLFGPIDDAPGGDGPAVITVLQITHALGDGRRTSAIARALFTTDTDDSGADRDGADRARSTRSVAHGIPAVSGAVLGAVRFPVDLATTVVRGATAYRRARQAPPRPADGVPLSTLNRPPGHDRVLRTLVLRADRLKPFGHNVTVGALTAISEALPEYLADPDRRYAVELTVGRQPPAARSAGFRRARPRNVFRNCAIDLHTGEADLASRAARIRDEIAAARAADDDPVRTSARAASAAAPPVLTHWGIRQFDPAVRPASVTGVTVVSSVNRGPADLELPGGSARGAVRFTAGYPALSPAQGLTHGVHGIGDTVAISVTTSAAVCPDVDRYVDLLSAAVDRIARLGAPIGE